MLLLIKTPQVVEETKNKKIIFKLSHLFNDVMDMVVEVVLCVNGISAHFSVNIIF